MPESPAIPALTPEENALARQAEHSEHVMLAVAIRYLHWAKARAELLDMKLKASQLPLDLETEPVSDRSG